jgi:hypothetical protein
MAYAPVGWVDDVTPLDQAHLNQMDQGIAALDGQVSTLSDDLATTNSDLSTLETQVDGIAASVAAIDLTVKVDKDSVVVAASRLMASKLLAADANPAFRLNGDGTIQWGPGGATALDTSLFRFAANHLRSPGSLDLGAGLVTRVGLASQVNIDGGVGFGTAADVTLVRTSAGLLTLTGTLNVTGSGGVNALGGELLAYASDANMQSGITSIGGNPGLQLGQTGGASLYRSAAGVLKTDGRFVAADANYAYLSQPAAGGGYAFASFIAAEAQPRWRMAAGNGTMEWGVGGATAPDTNLYRAAGGTLKTDGVFRVATNLYIEAASGGITLGPNDTNLYRAAAGVLRTDGGLQANTHLYALTGNVYLGDPGGRLYFAGDTSLYRAAAGYVQTDGAVIVGSHIYARQQVIFGTAGDANIHRSAAGVLALTMGALGDRDLVYGAADSGGAGFRTVRVAN